MSIFTDIDTLCSRENNRCQRRKKCWRYMREREADSWIADYWPNFEEFCNFYIPLPKPEKQQ